MSRKFNGSSDIAYTGTWDFSSSPDLQISAWVYRDNTNTNQIVFEYDGDGGSGFDVIFNTNNAANSDLIRSYQLGGADWSDTYARPSINAWHHYLWIIPGNGTGGPNNQTWIDGSQVSLSTLSHVSVGAFGSTSFLAIMGRRTGGGTNSLFTAGRIAEFAIWSSYPYLTSSQIKALAAGESPMYIAHPGLIFYAPFLGDSPEADYHGGTNHPVTISGTTVVAHPGVRTLRAVRSVRNTARG